MTDTILMFKGSPCSRGLAFDGMTRRSSMLDADGGRTSASGECTVMITVTVVGSNYNGRYTREEVLAADVEQMGRLTGGAPIGVALRPGKNGTAREAELRITCRRATYDRMGRMSEWQFMCVPECLGFAPKTTGEAANAMVKTWLYTLLKRKQRSICREATQRTPKHLQRST